MATPEPPASPAAPTDESKLAHVREVLETLHADLLGRVQKAEADARTTTDAYEVIRKEYDDLKTKYDAVVARQGRLVAVLKETVEVPTAPAPAPPAA
ncbi:MAG TPA: hypothetical protein VMG81_00790 [Thermoplasmata archaeon]|nr:hypothetical protein [Thermoplasmata archaeon]